MQTYLTTGTIKIRRGAMEKYGALQMLRYDLFQFTAKGTKSKNLELVRDIVIGLHLYAEYWIDFLIVGSYLKVIKGKRGRSFRDVVLTKLRFHDKLLIAKEINLIEKEDFKMIEKLNDLRNAFAHGYPISSNKFIYKNKKITSWGHVAILVKDFERFLANIIGQKIDLLPKQEKLSFFK